MRQAERPTQSGFLDKVDHQDDKCTGVVFDIQRYSLHDGPGIRTLVFMKGCPLRCLWCDNPESQRARPEILEFEERCIGCGDCFEVCSSRAIMENQWRIDRDKCDRCGRCVEVCPARAREIAGKRYAVGEVLREVEKDRVAYEVSGGGVTVSGGEPASQAGFVSQLLRACRHKGIHTALETSGYAAWDEFERILTYVDLLLYDLKCIDSERHSKLTGVSNQRILENIKKAADLVAGIYLRVPIIPGLNDDEENLKATARLARQLGDSVVQVHVLAYHSLGANKYGRLGREYPLSDTDSPSDEDMQNVRRLFESYGLRTQIGG